MFGKHAIYIIPSYAITGLVIVVLIVWILAVYKRRKREIAELEKRGITRASASGGRP